MQVQNSTRIFRCGGKPVTFQTTPQPRFAKGPEQTDIATLSGQAVQHQKELALELLRKVAAAVDKVAPEQVKFQAPETSLKRPNLGWEWYSSNLVPQYTIPFGENGNVTIGFLVKKDSAGSPSFSYKEVKQTLSHVFFRFSQSEIVVPMNLPIFDYTTDGSREKLTTNHYHVTDAKKDPNLKVPNIFLTYLKSCTPSTFDYSATGREDLSFRSGDVKLATSGLNTLITSLLTLNKKYHTAESKRTQLNAEGIEAARTTQAVNKANQILELAGLPT